MSAGRGSQSFTGIPERGPTVIWRPFIGYLTSERDLA